MEDKQSDLQNKKEDNDRQKQEHIDNLNDEVKSLKNGLMATNINHNTEINMLKNEIRKKDESLQELKSLFEREKIIYNSKIQHLEEFLMLDLDIEVFHPCPRKKKILFHLDF